VTETPFSFPSSWRWLDRPPLRLDTGLQGHVTVVLYWRVGCAHSRAALSELALASLRERDRAVAFVAVHVPVEPGEEDDERVRRQLAQLPAPLVAAVAADAGEVERLPTMVLVDAAGVVQARAPGVPRRRRLREAVGALCRQADESGQAALVPFVPHDTGSRGGLRATAAAHDGERLWLASAGQRRVLAVDGDGNVTHSFGSGAWGKQDGDAASCSFALPAALCVHDGFVAVADAQTHVLRAIDIGNGDVTTWVGTGQFGADDVGGGYGSDQPLCSPAGMVSHDGGLYLCQTGVEQLWQVDPMTGAAMAWLGANYGGEEFRQPVALAQLDDQLWLCEAGAGALTCVDLAHVEVRERRSGMHRPSGVAVVGERIFVADAGRGEVLERIAAEAGLRRCFGPDDGLREPVALASDGERLFVVDAAADRVFVATVGESLGPLQPFELHGLPEPARLRSGPRAVVARPCHLAEHSDVTLTIALPGQDGETVVVDVVDEADPVLAVPRDTVVEVRGGRIEVLLPIAEGLLGALRIRLQVAGRTRHYVLPVTVGTDGATEAELVV
jgi:hypothetical protein